VEKISFGNKEYVKASEIAKQFRYTQDYVGQLCRSKKVDARLVGRTWYLTKESVAVYRKTKHKTQKKTVTAKTILHTNKPHRSTVSTKVHPVIRRKTAKATKLDRHLSNTGVTVAYSHDKAANIPITTGAKKLSKKTAKVRKPAPIKLQKLSETKLKVRSGKNKYTNFSTEKMPEISLSGKLKITDDMMGVSQDLTDTTPKISRTKPAELQVKSSKVTAVRTGPQINSSTESSATFTPQVIQSPVAKSVKSVNRLAFYRVFFATTVGFIIASVILITESVVVASQSALGVTSVDFDFTQLLKLFN
jgi:hypothetical protein